MRGLRHTVNDAIIELSRCNESGYRKMFSIVIDYREDMQACDAGEEMPDLALDFELSSAEGRSLICLLFYLF